MDCSRWYCLQFFFRDGAVVCTALPVSAVLGILAAISAVTVFSANIGAMGYVSTVVSFGAPFGAMASDGAMPSAADDWSNSFRTTVLCWRRTVFVSQILTLTTEVFG